MNPEIVAEILGELTLLKYFPGDPAGRTALFLLVGRMCSSEDQVRYLVRRTLAICNEWPGPLVLRQILSFKYKPADGISVSSSPMFLDGVPPERIEAPFLPALPPGKVASVDPGIEKGIKLLSIAKDLNRVPRKVPEVPTNPDYKPVTQADIDKAVSELRDKRAKEELGE